MRENVEAVKILGDCGRMVGASKSIYLYDNPKNAVIFNANICAVVGSKPTKIWYGDLDLTNDYNLLKKLSKKLNADLYILWESDARFANELSPRIDKAVFIVSSDSIRTEHTSLFYVDNGIPMAYSDEEYLANNPPTERVAVTYDKKLFRRIDLPNLKKLKGNKRQEKSPVQQLQDYFIKKYGRTKATTLYRNLYIREDDSSVLESNTRDFIKALFPDMHPVKIDQSVSMEMFMFMPSLFEDIPDWSTKGAGYVRKGKTVK